MIPNVDNQQAIPPFNPQDGNLNPNDIGIIAIGNNEELPNADDALLIENEEGAGCCTSFWIALKKCFCCYGDNSGHHEAYETLEKFENLLSIIPGDRARAAYYCVTDFKSAAKNWSKICEALNSDASIDYKNDLILELTRMAPHMNRLDPTNAAEVVFEQFEGVFRGSIENEAEWLALPEELLAHFACIFPCLPARHSFFFGLDSATISEALAKKTRDESLHSLVMFYHETNPPPQGTLVKANHFRMWALGQIQVLGRQFEDGTLDRNYLEYFIRDAVSNFILE